MNLKKILIVPIYFLIIPVVAQVNLPIPLDILNTGYQTKTRSFDGAPGENYWQNSASYEIDVELIPGKREIIGSETITYFNNSPDTLRYLVIKLFPNLYKKGVVRDYSIDQRDIYDGIKISHISVSGKVMDTSQLAGLGTNLIVNVDEFLFPGKTIKLSIDWSYQLPDYSNIRQGVYEQNEIFVAYWFPRIAVYDDIEGWDTFNYTGMQEFYNDFSDFYVNITVPSHYVTWATGELINAQDVFTKTVLKKYKKAQTSSEIINIITKENYEKNDVTNQKDEKLIYQYKATNVTDFAFAASNDYLWDASGLTLSNGKNVFAGAAYDENSQDFYSVAEIARKSIEYFSDEMPGVPYPYPTMTIFNGGGGMEFPMMVNDGTTVRWSSTVHLTSHEVAHTYFPFYMGTNETKYAYMDEGWATMLPFKFQSELAKGYDPIARVINYYEPVAGTELDIPIMTPSILMGGNAYRPTYRNNSYYKSGIAYHLLHDMLGDQLFKKALHEFMDRWHGKHPLPYDFFLTFNDVVGEDLNWFWLSWFYESGYPDLAIEEVTEENDSYHIRIRKVGNIPIPIHLTFIYEDGSKEVIKENMKVWEGNSDFIFVEKATAKVLQKIVLGNDHIPDINDGNNEYVIEKL